VQKRLRLARQTRSFRRCENCKRRPVHPHPREARGCLVRGSTRTNPYERKQLIVRGVPSSLVVQGNRAATATSFGSIAQRLISRSDHQPARMFRMAEPAKVGDEKRRGARQLAGTPPYLVVPVCVFVGVSLEVGRRRARLARALSRCRCVAGSRFSVCGLLSALVVARLAAFWCLRLCCTSGQPWRSCFPVARGRNVLGERPKRGPRARALGRRSSRTLDVALGKVWRQEARVMNYLRRIPRRERPGLPREPQA